MRKVDDQVKVATDGGYVKIEGINLIDLGNCARLFY